MKDDFAGGRFPTDKFGANAAWWAIMILALNLLVLMQRLVMGENGQKKDEGDTLCTNKHCRKR